MKKIGPLTISERDTNVLTMVAKVFGIIIAFSLWYISIPLIAIWYIVKKTKWNLKTKRIAIISVLAFYATSIGWYAYISQPPRITINEPEDGYSIQSDTTLLKGSVWPKDVSLTLNGQGIRTQEGEFEFTATLKDEKNSFTFKVRNRNGEDTQKITINRIFTEEEQKQREEEREAKKAAQEQAKQERITREEAEQLEWERSEAGQICTANPTWSKRDCEKLADGLIWIGMSLDMLKYKRGLPNTVNVSNYGTGDRYQWCWRGYTPSCFYGGVNGIVESYN